MTGGMMGRTSDTRIYNPRSESSEMFRANHEDERPPSGVEDAKDKESRQDKRQAKKEAEEKEDKKIRHIKVRSHHLGLGGAKPTEAIDEEDKAGKKEADLEPDRQTMPSGAGGFMTSLAMGAKGPGAAGGEMIQMSEPMRMANQLLKEQIGERAIDGVPHVTWMSPKKITGWIDGRLMLFGLPEWAANNQHTANISGEEKPFTPQEQFMSQVFDESGNLKGEPMGIAYQLLKEELQSNFHPEVYNRFQAVPDAILEAARSGNEKATQAIDAWLDGDVERAGQLANEAIPPRPMRRPIRGGGGAIGDNSSLRQPRLADEYEHLENSMGNTMDDAESLMLHGNFNHDPLKSEPMDIAWSLLKSESKRSVARRRKKEGYAKWRPSTGQFERPKGGGDPRNATSRRAKNISRNLPLGRKTGLMKPHLSVEMSHRGLASKQPLSKDPQKYGAYKASQEARKLQGGVRSTITPHMRHSQRSFISGQTGGGRLTNTLQYPRVPRPRLHAVRAPSIQPPKMKMPHLVRPKMPGMVTMSEDTPQHSDILKAGNAYQAALMRIALKEIRELMREKKDKDKKTKGKGNPDTAGAASNLPNYEANNPKTATRPEGGTEDENDSRLWGLAPGDIAGSGRV